MRLKNLPKKRILLISVTVVCAVSLVSLIVLTLPEDQSARNDSQKNPSPQIITQTGKLEEDPSYLFAKQLGPGTAGYSMYYLAQTGSNTKYYLVRGSNDFYTDTDFFLEFGVNWQEATYTVSGYTETRFYECIDKTHDYTHTFRHITVIKVITMQEVS